MLFSFLDSSLFWVKLQPVVLGKQRGQDRTQDMLKLACFIYTTFFFYVLLKMGYDSKNKEKGVSLLRGKMYFVNHKLTLSL